LDFEKIEDNPVNTFTNISTNVNCEVLLAAIPRGPVDVLVKTIARAGLTPLVMELESAAICRTLKFEHKLETATVIVHIGDAKTNIIVYADNAVRFTFSIPISNSYFLDTIAKNLEVDILQAEELKREYGIQGFAGLKEIEEQEITNEREKIKKRMEREENFKRGKF